MYLYILSDIYRKLLQIVCPNTVTYYFIGTNRVFKLRICACMCGGACVPECTCGSQRTKCESWVTPSPMWVTEVEFRSSSLVASVFTCRAIFLALTNSFFFFLKNHL